MKRFGRPRFTENFTSSTTFEGPGISEAAAAEAAAVEAAAAEAAAERAAVRLPLPGAGTGRDFCATNAARSCFPAARPWSRPWSSPRLKEQGPALTASKRGESEEV